MCDTTLPVYKLSQCIQYCRACGTKTPPLGPLHHNTTDKQVLVRSISLSTTLVLSLQPYEEIRRYRNTLNMTEYFNRINITKDCGNSKFNSKVSCRQSLKSSHG